MGLIEVDQDGGLVRVRLNRPDKHNAQTPAMWHELRRAGERLVGDPAVRCVVLSGNGPSFSSGLDRTASANGEITGGALSGDPAVLDRVPIEDADIAVAQAAFRWPTEAPFVTVAAVHGYALGAGAELALACDLRILSEDALLGLPEAELGMMPDMGGCERLGQLVGYSRALELALTGRRLSSAQALEMGLANAVVPGAELTPTVDRLAELIAGRPAATVRHVKRAVAASAAGDREGSFRIARQGALELIARRGS
jgi:enoyl-CoA hydratase/carnithine racemase